MYSYSTDTLNMSVCMCFCCSFTLAGFLRFKLTIVSEKIYNCSTPSAQNHFKCCFLHVLCIWSHFHILFFADHLQDHVHLPHMQFIRLHMHYLGFGFEYVGVWWAAGGSQCFIHGGNAWFLSSVIMANREETEKDFGFSKSKQSELWPCGNITGSQNQTFIWIITAVYFNMDYGKCSYVHKKVFLI